MGFVDRHGNEITNDLYVIGEKVAAIATDFALVDLDNDGVTELIVFYTGLDLDDRVWSYADVYQLTGGWYHFIDTLRIQGRGGILLCDDGHIVIREWRGDESLVGAFGGYAYHYLTLSGEELEKELIVEWGWHEDWLNDWASDEIMYFYSNHLTGVEFSQADPPVYIREMFTNFDKGLEITTDDILTMFSLSAPAPPPDGVVFIRTASELAAISGSDGHYVLANDISFTGRRPIENFRGTLDGAGHTVTLSVTSATHLATAGLFGGITEGTVIIRNLSVRTSGTGTVNARAPGSSSSHAFAGGLIGTVKGGDVTIENVSFNGNVRAFSLFDRLVSGINQNPFRNLPQFIFGGMTNMLAPWAQVVYYLAYYGGYQGLYTALTENGSRAYAGGLIGFIGGDANVRIVNSFARGSVRADASLSLVEVAGMIGTTRARAYAGGLVGLRSGNARLSIENSYVTNDIHARADTPIAGSPDAFSGSLVGRGGITATVGTIYRHSQNLSTNRGPFPTFQRGRTNTDGITGTLSQAEMRNRNSFAGWDFDYVWTIEPARNNGFPFL